MFSVTEDNEVKLNFHTTRSHVIRSIEYRLLKGVLEMSAQTLSAGVADFLMRFPVRGIVGDFCHCPLAEWVREVVEAEIRDFEAYSLDGLAVNQESIRVGILHTVRGSVPRSEDYEIQIPLPIDGVLQRFIAEFDSNAYPDLIEA